MSPEQHARSPIRRALQTVFGCSFLGAVLVLTVVLLISSIWPPHGRVGPEAGGPRVQLPSPTTLAAASACIECHNVLTDDGFIAEGIRYSHLPHLAEPVHCQTCHDTLEHTFTEPTTLALCLSCHESDMQAGDKCMACHVDREGTKPPDHSSGSWRYAHGGNGSSSVPSHNAVLACEQCHDSGTFCLDCHTLKIPHPADFRVSHVAIVRDGSADCSVCHDASECDSCHGSARPASHEAQPFEHWQPELLASSQCTTCHAASYCVDCHLGQKPESHSLGWKHGDAALAVSSRCGLCHEESYCLDCHGLEMPHRGGFVRTHGETGDQRLCYKCHTRSECLDCHKVVYPASHRAPDWKKSHAGEETTCEVCHDAPACTACHGIALPHGAEFAADHADESLASPELCAKCHPVEDCMSCHEGRNPSTHVAGFKLKHKDAALGHIEYCLLCHTKVGTCNRCHGVVSPELP